MENRHQKFIKQYESVHGGPRIGEAGVTTTETSEAEIESEISKYYRENSGISKSHR